MGFVHILEGWALGFATVSGPSITFSMIDVAIEK